MDLSSSIPEKKSCWIESPQMSRPFPSSFECIILIVCHGRNMYEQQKVPPQLKAGEEQRTNPHKYWDIWDLIVVPWCFSVVTVLTAGQVAVWCGFSVQTDSPEPTTHESDTADFLFGTNVNGMFMWNKSSKRTAERSRNRSTTHLWSPQLSRCATVR